MNVLSRTDINLTIPSVFARASATPARIDGKKAGRIRAFEKADIPRVCELFSKTFRPGRRHRSDDLATCLEATYFGSPAYTPDTGSIVHVDAAGRVNGFLGVIAITLRLGDRPLRAGILSAYMAEDPERNPDIGVRLARSILARPFDLVFTDTANRTSLDISRALRFTVSPLQSLEWVKILRPIGTSVHFLSKRVRGLAPWLFPVTAAADALLERFRTADQTLDNTLDRPLAPQDFVAAADAFVNHDALRPAWERQSELGWFLTQAALQTKNGPLHIREVCDLGGRRIGLYLLYARRGGVAHALQILCRPGREERVLGSLIRTATTLGAVSVRGGASAETIQGLIRQPGILYHHVMSTILWTKDPEILAAVRNGNVFLGGLAGETWARIVAEEFS